MFIEEKNKDALVKATTDPAQPISEIERHFNIAMERLAQSPQDALAHAQHALKLARESDDTATMARAQHVIGTAYLNADQHKIALEHLQNAIEMWQSLDNTLEVARSLNAIGILYRRLHDNEKALQYFERALTIVNDVAPESTEFLANIYGNLATIYINRGQSKKALTFQLKSLEMFESLDDHVRLSTVLNNIGGTLLEGLKQPEEALKYFQKALENWNELKQEYQKVLTLRNLSETYFRLENYDVALQYALDGLKLAETVESLQLQQNLTETLARVFEALGDHQQAAQMLWQLRDLERKLLDQDKQGQLIQMETRFEISAREREKELIQQKNLELESLNARLRAEVRSRQRVEEDLRLHQTQLETQNAELQQAHDELTLSRSVYLNLFDYAPIGYFIFDQWGSVVDVNLTGAEMVGLERRLLLKKPFIVFLEPESRSHFLEHITQICESKQPKSCELLLKPKQRFPFQIFLESRMYDQDLIRTAVIDISRQKQAEAGLRESEQRYHILAANLPKIDVFLFDKDLKFWIAEGQEMRQKGFDPANFVGKSVKSVIKPELVSIYQRTLNGESVSGEYFYDDSWYFYHSIPLWNQQEDVYAGVLIVQNVTDRKTIELDLRQTQEMLDLAMDSGAIAWWVWDYKTGQVDFDREKLVNLGFDLNQLSGAVSDYNNLVHPTDLKILNEKLEKHIRGGSDAFQTDTRIRMESGEWKWFFVRGKAVNGEQDRDLLKIAGVIVDVSERKALEEKVRRNNLELSRTMSHLQELNRQKDELFGIVAHDLNNRAPGRRVFQVNEFGSPDRAHIGNR